MSTPDDRMTNWPEYVSHKTVRAARIVNTTMEADGSRTLWVCPDGMAYDSVSIEQFVPTQKGMEERVGPGDWAIQYEDGFRSVSPNQAFGEGYIPKALIPESPRTLEKVIEHEINRFSAENGSDTPDFVLARYLMMCLDTWNRCVSAREVWYGRHEPMRGCPIDLLSRQAVETPR